MTTRTVRRLRKCHCQVASSKELQAILWERVRVISGARVAVRCLQCGAVWESDAKYTQRLRP